MVSYINSGSPPGSARFLTLYHSSSLHLFHVVHAAVDHVNQPSSGYTEHHHNDYFHLVLFTGTGGSFSYMGREYCAEEGRLLLISPDEMHSFDTKGKESRYSEVTFTLHQENSGKTVSHLDFGILFSALTGREVLEVQMPLDLSESDRKEMVLNFNHLLQGLLLNSAAGELLWQQALGNLFSILCREYFLKDGYDRLHKDHSGFETARLYIENHYTETVPADILADLARVSRGHFFRKFKFLYGVTAVRYQRMLRINAAKNLLKIGDQPSRVIAEQLGFSDVYHFARTFCQETGITPGKYRNHHKFQGNHKSIHQSDS